jgi:hypothetical protein
MEMDAFMSICRVLETLDPDQARRVLAAVCCLLDEPERAATLLELRAGQKLPQPSA